MKSNRSELVILTNMFQAPRDAALFGLPPVWRSGARNPSPFRDSPLPFPTMATFEPATIRTLCANTVNAKDRNEFLRKWKKNVSDNLNRMPPPSMLLGQEPDALPVS